MSSKNLSNLNSNLNNEKNLIDTRTLSDKVYSFLTDKILEGEISYGDRLNIREIANLLGISTIPVREALIRLSLEDVVIIKPRSTCVVKTPTQKSMLEAFEIREVIELHAINKIYPDIIEEGLIKLEHYLNMMDTYIPTNNEDPRMRDYAKYDQLFHQEFVVLAQNDSLLKVYRTNMMHLNIFTTFTAGIEPNIDQVHSDHRAILTHLKHNSSEAVNILRKHLKQCRHNLMQGDRFKSLELE